jgi:hypothetical protein
LAQQLGWASVYAYNNETFGPGGMLGWSSDREVVLTRYLRDKIVEFNPGLGSGIKRALEKWSAIDFTDDHDGCLFTATVYRKASGKCRESVGKDPECLSGKTFYHHS